MSGGAFNHDQYIISHITDIIEDFVIKNEDNTEDEWGYTKGRHFRPSTIKQFRVAILLLHIAQTFAQRIDWLVSDDDGEDTFHKRLQKEMEMHVPDPDHRAALYHALDNIIQSMV